jgi:hypothetical protein
MSNESNSQTKPYSDILPKGIKANPILDSSSYLPDSLRLTVFNFLKTKGFDLTKCFCDKEIGCNKKDNTLEIRIWDVDDLSVRKKREKLKREVEYESTHPNFYSGIIVYDIKTKTIKFYGDE